MSRLAPRLAIAALLAACFFLVRGTRWRLAAAHARVVETHEVYPLPPPHHLVRLSLGHRAALADLLWADVLITQGLRTMAGRRFEHVDKYLEAITELDPRFRDPYRLGEALITFQVGKTTAEDARKARRILERGVKNRPFDAELWLTLGQFLAFEAPASYLSEADEKREWRAAGARALARAAELGAGNDTVGWHALGGAGLLYDLGEREATVRFLELQLAVTNDPELRRQITERLERAVAAQEERRLLEWLKLRAERFEALRLARFPRIDRYTTIQLLGPPFDPARCAGGAARDEAACATTWRAWSESLGAARR